ncbi:glycosyltransferase [Limosilactobacillus reuteri]|uniref:glycosyltransferase n=1 Tax=Limosilactobacillus reuteri TaxID=1598 RepID=UPI00399251B3
MKKIKTYLKERKDSGLIPTTSELIKKSKNYSYISFDVFDTLLKRNVSDPSYVFDLVQLQIENQEKDFKQKRIKAEVQARKLHKSEVTLDDIYEEYPANEKLKSKLKLLELNTEKSCLTVNLDMIDFFNYCVKHKEVYIISDMYLSEKFIKSILRANGITGYKKLYVSCELKKTKHDGSLFDLYLKQNNIIPKMALHVGDSWRSDYKSAKTRGINVLHIPRIIKNRELIYSNQKINGNYLNEFVNNKVKSNDNCYYKFGYQKFGPFLWGYVRWIHNKLEAMHIKKVYFFSRDGFIMMKAFNSLYNEQNIEVHYLEVSRRSLRVPILHFDHSFKTIMGMISPSKMIPIISIFDCVGLNIKNYGNLLKKYGFDINDSFDRNSIMSNIKLQQLYQELSADIEEKSNEEYGALIRYLKQEKVRGKFGIVDIGWSGGMQRFLTETLNRLKIANEIYGYYIGVASYYTRNANVIPNLKLNGYLFDFKNDSNAKDKRSSFVGLFESLFLEQGGSVQNYSVRNDGNVIANRAPYEYMINGKETYELEAVRQIQSGALKFIEDAKKDYLLGNILAYNTSELFRGLMNTGQNPNKHDLELFSSFRFFDEGETTFLAKPKKINYYIFKPAELKQDFLLSRWKIGFMKRLLKINLPYQRLYEWLLKYK